MRKSRVLIQFTISIAILTWLLQLADATKVSASISALDSLYLAVAALIFITASTMIALTLFVPLKKIDVKTRTSNAIPASFPTQLLSDTTPARSECFFASFILNKMDGMFPLLMRFHMFDHLQNGNVNEFFLEPLDSKDQSNEEQ